MIFKSYSTENGIKYNFKKVNIFQIQFFFIIIYLCLKIQQTYTKLYIILSF